MKRNIVRTTLVTVFAVTLLATLAATTKAEDTACSLYGVAGKYAFSDSGTVFGVGPRVAIGIFTLDTSGKILNGRATASLNGTISDEAFTGTYTVNANCTGTFGIDIRDLSGELVLTVTGDFAWDDNMRELRFIFRTATLPNGSSLVTGINGNARKMGQ